MRGETERSDGSIGVLAVFVAAIALGCGSSGREAGETAIGGDAGGELSGAPRGVEPDAGEGAGAETGAGACRREVRDEGAETRCGPCGLGTWSCDGGEGGECAELEIPGIDADGSREGCADSVLFVDRGAPRAGSGTRRSPFRSYGAAREAARPGQTIVLAGTGPYREPLTVREGVSVVGGFSGAPEFRFDEGARTVFRVTAADGESLRGLEASGIERETVVANVRVETGEADPGRTNYGAYLRDSPGVVLRDVRVEAGRGGPGADGRSGASGADGDDGGDADGSPPCWYETSPDCAEPSGYRADNGGANSECPAADGGDGGNGAIQYRLGEAIDGLPPRDGAASAAGIPGGTGAAASGSPEGGGDGADGTPGRRGSDGGATAPGGSVREDVWAPSGRGEDGLDGEHGAGGGGGGGASGIYVCDSTTERLGAEGGGGGAGGCGGEGGTGGEPGGGSFGLFLVRSDVRLVDSEFEAGPGGEGGDGGSGGAGGRGGEAGRGSRFVNPPSCVGETLRFSSGRGGEGGEGGRGGAGAGGAGGVSIGAYCHDSSPTRRGDVRFASGGGGEGGASPGEDGRPGESIASVECE